MNNTPEKIILKMGNIMLGVKLSDWISFYWCHLGHHWDTGIILDMCSTKERWCYISRWLSPSADGMPQYSWSHYVWSDISKMVLRFAWCRFTQVMWHYTSGPWFNIKMSSYQYRKSHCGDKTVVRSSCLHNGISYTGKMSSLYWIRALEQKMYSITLSSKLGMEACTSSSTGSKTSLYTTYISYKHETYATGTVKRTY